MVELAADEMLSNRTRKLALVKLLVVHVRPQVLVAPPRMVVVSLVVSVGVV